MEDRGRRRKTKKASLKVEMKIVRIDQHTQIEVPAHLSDDVARERYLIKRKPVPKPLINTEVKKINEKPSEPEELMDFLEDDPELAVDEEGDE